MSKTEHRQCHVRTVQISPGRDLWRPHIGSQKLGSQMGQANLHATRRQGQEGASGLSSFWRKRLPSHGGIFAQQLAHYVCSCLRCFRQPPWSYESCRAQATQRHCFLCALRACGRTTSVLQKNDKSQGVVMGGERGTALCRSHGDGLSERRRGAVDRQGGTCSWGSLRGRLVT